MGTDSKAFILEQTDFRGPGRSDLIKNIRKLVESQAKDPKELAQSLKQLLEEEHGQYWHVVVGTDYAAFMTFTPGYYIRVSYGDLNILMFRLG